MFLVSGVYDRGAAHLSNAPIITIKRPAAYLVRSDHILDEKNTSTKAQRQLVEQFNVLEQIIVRGVCVRVFVVMSVD